MKTIKDYIQECDASASALAGGFGSGNATPSNTMGMGNPDGTEIPTAKAQVEKPKKKKKKKNVSESETINEFAMKFNKKGFLGELGLLMAKYKVRFVHDVEGSYFEDENGDMILDLTNQFITPEKMKKIAVKTK